MIVKQEILFNDDECDEIIKLPKNNHQKWKGSNRKYDSFSIDISDENIWIFDRLKRFFEGSIKTEISSIKKQIHYHEFSEGDFFSVHNDNRDNRIYSVGVLLNDNFEGGNFNLYNPDLVTLDKNQGNAYIFDVNISHEITTVVSGKRLSLIWFLQIDNFEINTKRII